MTTTLLAPSVRLANEAIAKRIVAKVRDHSPAPGLLTLVLRFRGSNHIDIIINLVLRSALSCARLEGRPQATWCRRSFETPCFARLLRMRSVGLNSNWSDLIGFMESIH